MAANLREFVQSGLANIVGSCCGSRPEHTRAIAEAVAGIPPRQRPEPATNTLLSGIETLEIRPDSNFINVGERANVTGSARFRRLIRRERYEDAVTVARQQVENGAQVLDVNMDEGMLDSEAAMERYLKLLAAEPDISRVPIMVDSSRFSVIEAGLKCLQGKGIVNSISLKEGEDEFIRQARVIRRYGAAVIVMAFDERGQADTIDRKVAICERSYRILTERVGFAPQDIIFDPNIFAIATGIEEHDDYAVAFIQAARELKRRFPLSHVSGGVSNVSFSFRGNDASARPSTPSSSTTPPAPAWTWASSTPDSSASMRTSPSTCATPSRTSSSTGPPTPPSAYSQSPTPFAPPTAKPSRTTPGVPSPSPTVSSTPSSTA